MKDSLKFVLCHLSVLFLIVAIVCCCFFLTENNVVHADYEDLNDFDIINFNQLFNITQSNSANLTFNSGYELVVNNDLTSQVSVTLRDFTFLANHTYLIHLSSDFNSYCPLAYGGSAIVYVKTDRLYTPSTDLQINRFYVASGVQAGIYDINIIDLTQCFGENNIPTLNEALDYFVSFYNYTTGTAISFNSLNSYIQGYNDAMSSFDINYNVSDFNHNVYAYSGTMSFSRDFSSSYQSVYFNDIIVFPLGFNFVQGDYFTVTLRGLLFDSYLADPMGIFYVGYFDDHNDFQPFYTIDYSEMTRVDNTGIGGGILYNAPSTININFVVPSTISSIVFKYTYSGNGDIQDCSARIGAFSLVGNTYNATAGINTAYDSGYNEASNYFNAYYGVNGSGYDTIYNAGYQAGLNEQDIYTFGSLMTSVVEAPLNAVLSMFNFNFLGYNLKDFVTVIFTLLVIATIVRLIMGGGNA